MVRFQTFEQVHNKSNIGSTRLRVHNLIKNWPDASLYKYGEFPDVMIYQKVYTTIDYKLQQHFENLQILDICDPDFKDSADVYIKETIDAMDAVVVPTESMRAFMQQMTDTPVRVIKDRFDLSEFPNPKKHTIRAKTAVWFGYAHNAGALKFAVQSLESRDLDLIVISDEDPMPYRWAMHPEDYEKRYTYVKFKHPDMYKHMQKADICVLPKNVRPWEHFKSENKTVIAQLLGLPVAEDAEQLDKLLDAEARNKAIDSVYGKLVEEYDCKKSVQEYKDLIEEIAKK